MKKYDTGSISLSLEKLIKTKAYPIVMEELMIWKLKAAYALAVARDLYIIDLIKYKMNEELIFKNVQESLKDLVYATGSVEREMHMEIILESLEMLKNGRKNK